MNGDKLLLRVEEAAERLSIGRSKCYELLASGELRPIKIGRAVRISARELEAWVQRQEAGEGAA